MKQTISKEPTTASKRGRNGHRKRLGHRAISEASQQIETVLRAIFARAEGGNNG